MVHCVVLPGSICIQEMGMKEGILGKKGIWKRPNGTCSLGEEQEPNEQRGNSDLRSRDQPGTNQGGKAAGTDGSACFQLGQFEIDPSSNFQKLK